MVYCNLVEYQSLLHEHDGGPAHFGPDLVDLGRSGPILWPIPLVTRIHNVENLASGFSPQDSKSKLYPPK